MSLFRRPPPPSSKPEPTIRELVDAVERFVPSPYPNTPALYDKTLALLQAAKFPEPVRFARQTGVALANRLDADGISHPAFEIAGAMLGVAEDLYLDEMLTEPPPQWISLSEIDRGRLRDVLIRMQTKLERPERTLEIIKGALVASFHALTRCLPPMALVNRDAKNAPTIPLIDLMPDVGRFFGIVVLPYFSAEVKALGLFGPLRAQLEANYQAASARSSALADSSQAKGPAREVLQTYLGNTSLAELFDAEIPFQVPLSRRLEHTAIVAGTGWGKTQLLQSMIAHDLEEPDPPAMVVLDSTGAMVKRIQRLAVFNERLRDRLIIIDPEDDPVPALNMFDVSNPRLQTYGRAVREEVETEIIALFNYVFDSLASELTGRMSTTFSFIVRLMLSIPGSNIHTLRELLEDDTDAFAPHIAKLDATTQAFFKNQFYLKTFRTTRASIAQRLYGIIQVPAFERMFYSTNRLDMYAELQRGAIILVNTSTRLLKEEASPLFGRYIIARTLAAVFERAAISEEDRRPAFLIVDEAAPYFDDTFDAMLTRVRQYKLGVVIAFQHLEQTSEKLRSAIASNTSVKMAGGLGYSDSRWLSREMRTTPEFLQAQKRDPRDPPKFTQFACYVRNYTDTAVSLTVPIGTLEDMPRMTDAEHAQLRARNRSRMTDTTPRAPRAAAPTIQPAPAPPQKSGPPAPKVKKRDEPPESEAASDWE